MTFHEFIKTLPPKAMARFMNRMVINTVISNIGPMTGISFHDDKVAGVYENSIEEFLNAEISDIAIPPLMNLCFDSAKIMNMDVICLEGDYDTFEDNHIYHIRNNMIIDKDGYEHIILTNNQKIYVPDCDNIVFGIITSEDSFSYTVTNYNARVYCVDSDNIFISSGKIYNIVNGFLCDEDNKMVGPFSSYDDFWNFARNQYDDTRWIEVEEDN